MSKLSQSQSDFIKNYSTKNSTKNSTIQEQKQLQEQEQLQELVKKITDLGTPRKILRFQMDEVFF